MSSADGRVRVWRRRGERLDPVNVIQRDRYGGGSVMVLAGIYHNGKTELITVAGNLTSQKYCDEIIEPVVVLFMKQHDVTLFRQDNACPRTARYTQDAIRRIIVQVLP